MVNEIVEPEEKVVTEVGFETEGEKDWVVMNADSAWAWPSAISNEMAKSGTYSFKVTPRADGGKWPKMEIQFGAATFDMTNYDKVSLWIYNAGDSEFPNFGLMILDASDAKVQITKNVPAGEWTQFVVTKAMMTAKGLDITALRLEFGNCNSDYPNRAVFYIDDVKLEEAAAVIDTKELGFESDAELANIKYDGENNIFWPTTISSEQAKSGNSSLKVTPHASWGTWPSFHFMFGESITVDMTNYTKISLWVYNSGEENIPSLGMAAYSGNNKVEYTKDAVAGEWTEYVITKDALVAAGVDITAVSIKFGNYNGVYTNRAVFYIDDVKLS